MTAKTLRTNDHETFSLAGLDVSVCWRRNARARRVSMRVDARTGMVVVTLPLRAGRRAGVMLLQQHSNWLLERIEALPLAIRFAAGASVPICGVPHLVRHAPDERGGAWLSDGAITVSGDAEFLSRRVADLLRAEARRRFGRLAVEIGRDALVARRICIKDTRTRWGSCTSTGTLMFNWRLVMAPTKVQHYVVAHELAHLRHMNHGPAFWALVRSLTEHEPIAEDWLRRHGAGLLRVG